MKCGLNSVTKVGTLCKQTCDPSTIKRRKVEEERIENLLILHGIEFRREVHISFCNVDGKQQAFARIDFIVTMNGIDFLLEIDEGQHRDRQIVCEVTRMIDVMRVRGEDKYIWLRFNPNCFRINNVVQKVSRSKREAHLIDVIKNWVWDGTTKIKYMYYDQDATNEPAKITKSEWFDQIRYLLA